MSNVPLGGGPPSPDRCPPALLVLEAEGPPGDDTFSEAARGATAATTAAWPRTSLTWPVVERRIEPHGRSGCVRDQLVFALVDPLGVMTERDALAELAEHARPLTAAHAMRRVGPGPVARLRRRAPAYVAELIVCETRTSWSAGAHASLLRSLVEGLRVLGRGAALAITLAPPRAPREDPDELAWPELTVRLRLEAEDPIPTVLMARALALCPSSVSVEGSAWRTPLGRAEHAAVVSSLQSFEPHRWDDEPDPRVSVATAASMLHFGAGAASRSRSASGRPVVGPLPKEGAVLGRVPRPSGRRVAWRLNWSSRRHHTFVAGSSGCGKSTLLLRLVVDDIAAGRCVVVVDPHGDLADQVARIAPRARLVRVDPRRADSAPLDLLDRDPGRAAAHVISAIDELWPTDFSGPVWQRGISIALRVLAARDGARPTSLHDLERFFTDAGWREAQIARLGDERLVAEARRESRAWEQQSNSDTTFIGWVASKFTPLTQGPASSLFTSAGDRSLEDIVRVGGVLLVTLPVGLLGARVTEMVGRMFLSRLGSAIAAQGTRAEHARTPVSVIADEAHLLAGPALSGLFAQARKFGGSVTVATQSPGQLGTELPGLLTNAQTLLLGRLPAAEAVRLADRTGRATHTRLSTLPRHHLVVVGEDHDPDAGPVVLEPVPPPQLPPEVPADEELRVALLQRLALVLGHLRAQRENPPLTLDQYIAGLDAAGIDLSVMARPDVEIG